MQNTFEFKEDFHITPRLKFIESILKNKKVQIILDIGSWHLQQSIEFCDTFPDASIYAFEACKKNFNLCEERLLNLMKIKEQMYKRFKHQVPIILSFYELHETGHNIIRYDNMYLNNIYFKIYRNIYSFLIILYII